MKFGFICAVGVALALAGCAGGQTAPGAAAAPLPLNYREQIAAKVKETFFDPYSIRDAQISAGIPGTSFLGSVTTVCMKANAKNRMGGYTGIQTTAYVFRDGHLTATDAVYSPIVCNSASYGPFPEIDAAAPPAAPAIPKRR
jgi:hypothetical protein